MEMFCTIFTPTYNRGYILSQLYESLKMQTLKDFEWIIIDDGSVDETEQLAKSWCKEDVGFSIIYKKVENGGKHRAINQAVQIAKGKMFFIVDSDDYLVKNAVEKIKYYESSLEGNKKKFAGVSGLRGYTEQKVIGEKLKKQYIDTDNTKRRKYHLLGDKAEVYYTEILKKYPFPEIKGEKFIQEAIVWNKIASDGYQIRWFNDIIYICNYLEDGLTKGALKLYKENPKGYLMYIKSEVKNTHPSYKRKLKYFYGYYIAVIDKKSEKDIAKELETNRTIIKILKIIHFIKNK